MNCKGSSAILPHLRHRPAGQARLSDKLSTAYVVPDPLCVLDTRLGCSILNHVCRHLRGLGRRRQRPSTQLNL